MENVALYRISGVTLFFVYEYFMSNIQQEEKRKEQAKRSQVKKNQDDVFKAATNKLLDLFKDKFLTGFNLLEDQGKNVLDLFSSKEKEIQNKIIDTFDNVIIDGMADLYSTGDKISNTLEETKTGILSTFDESKNTIIDSFNTTGNAITDTLNTTGNTITDNFNSTNKKIN